MSDSEIRAVTEIKVSASEIASEIASLEGIKFFTELQNLYFRKSSIRELDVSGMTKLISIDVMGGHSYTNRITRGSLVTVNVEGCTALRMLDCRNNKISSLKLPASLVHLVHLHCEENNITQLDISKLPDLRNLYCDNNKLAALDVGNLAELHTLRCRNNKIISLDLKNNSELYSLSCTSNDLEFLDLSANPSLEYLHCEGNKLKALQLNSNRLTTLRCSRNELTVLELWQCRGLMDLYCDNNKLTVLILPSTNFVVSGYNSSLRRIDCSNNKLSYLVFQSIAGLWWINCDKNNLLTLDWEYGIYESQIHDEYLRHEGKVDFSIKSQNIPAQYVLDNGAGSEYRYYYDFRSLIGTSKLQNISSDVVKAYSSSREIDSVYNNGVLYMKEKPSEIRYAYKTNREGIARTYSYDHATSYEINNNLNYIPVAFSVRGAVASNSKPVITTSDLPISVVNAPYGFNFKALGAQNITWSASNLPSGLTLSSSGFLSGTPTTAGKFSCNVTAKNSAGSTSQNFTLEITEMSDGFLPIITTRLTDPILTDTQYNFQLMAFGSPAFKWEITGGTLPDGLTLSSNALISGKAKEIGDSTITVRVSNSYGDSTRDINFYAYTLPPELTTEKLPDATDGKYYRTKINVKSDIEYTLTLSGDLPEGLEFDSTKGTISGTPKEPCKNRELLITATNAAGSTGKIYSLTVKGFAPKLPNIGAITLTENGFKIAATAGSQPITLKAYIDANTAKNIFYEVGDMSLDISSENYFSQYRSGFIFEAGQDDEGNPNGTGTFKFADNPHPDLYTNWPNVAYKNLPVVVVASNSQGVTTKTYKININGDSPEWYYTTQLYQTEGDIKAPDTFTITAKAGTEIESHEFLLYGSEPFRTQASMKSGREYQKNGIYLDYVEDCGYVIVQGTPTAGKETKTQFTLTGSNPSTKEKAKVKVIVVGQLAPQISSTADKLKKEIELGKNISLKPTVKGTKPITWSISDKDELEALGLSFDSSTGKISGTAKAPTVEDGEYSPRSFVLTAANSAGAANVTATIGVKGKKLKITTKEIKISTGENNNALKISSSLDNDS
ncbi:MAG: putative Ig domain-containing protein, partial [Synergistaceae bacterium]|nr:putative Ig domain-containing protein [Synergistaceae bacterium]